MRLRSAWSPATFGVAMAILAVLAVLAAGSGPAVAVEAGVQQGASTAATDRAAPNASLSEAEADADARLNSAGAAGADLFWRGQALAVEDPGRAGTELQLRVETDDGDDTTLPLGELSLDGDGAALVRTGAIPANRVPGDFVLAEDSTAFVVVDDGRVVGTTTDPDEAEFEIAPQRVRLSFSSPGAGVSDPATVEVASNRGTYRAYVTANRTSDRGLVAFFGQAETFNATDVDVDDDGNVTDGDGIRVRVEATDLRRELSIAPLAGDRETFRLNVTDTPARTNVTVDLVDLDVTGDGNPARDPDGDGLYEDVNGDGDVTPGDATVLFKAVLLNDPVVREHPRLFDFNGDGDAAPGDATVLFGDAF